MKEGERRWLVVLGALVAVLLPLLFNPYAAAPFEPSKVSLIRATALAMLLLVVLAAATRRFLPSYSTAPETSSALPGTGFPWWRAHPLAIPVVIYGAVMTLATIFSIDVHASLWGIDNHHGLVTAVAILLFFYLMAAALARWDQIQLLVTALILGSVPVALYGWVQYLGLDALSWITMSISPVHSTLGRSVFLGAYLAMITPFTLARIATPLHPGRRAGIALYAILALQVGCLLFTLARAAWLGFLGGGIVYVILAIPGRRRWIAGLVVAALAGALLFGFISLYGGTLFSQEAGMPPQEQFAALRRNSNSARITTWLNALQLVPERWLLGYGPETFVIAVERRGFARDSELPFWHFLDDPHNVFLYHLTGAGVTGLLAFLFVLVRFYRHGGLALAGRLTGEQRKTLAAIYGSATAYLIQAQLTPDVVTVSTLFWMNLALGVAAVRWVGTATADKTGSPRTHLPAD